MTTRFIVCAAMINADGLVIASPRHWDFVAHQTVRFHTGRFDHEAVEGFIDQFGKFLTRTEAWKVAEAAGQIRRRCGGDTANHGTLYSENLY